MGFPKFPWKTKKATSSSTITNTTEATASVTTTRRSTTTTKTTASRKDVKTKDGKTKKNNKDTKKKKKKGGGGGWFTNTLPVIKTKYQVRQEKLKKEEQLQNKLNYDIRLGIYLQVNEYKRQYKIQKEEERHEAMKYKLKMGIYLKFLYQNHHTYQSAKEELESNLIFKPPLTLSQVEALNPVAINDELHKKHVKTKKDPNEHVISIGVVPPDLKALIVAASLELRPVPPQHKKEYKPIMSEAAEIGSMIKLPEKSIEAYGTPKPAPNAIYKSIDWNPMGRVGLPKLTNKRSKAQQVIVEAAALGKIKRLKPVITYNYNPSELERYDDYLSDDDENFSIDIDDLVDDHGAKDMRTRHLIDRYVHEDRRHRRQQEKKEYWDPDEYDHYEQLDDVQLPTDTLPVYKPLVPKTITHEEYMESIARGVAEASWDRRYRLDRPKKQLKMRPHCTCRYCKTSNPYQTNAYRKRWLLQQGLWRAAKIYGN